MAPSAHNVPSDQAELDNPFWHFCVDFYAKPQVADACLELQNRGGVDVNVLLFGIWLGSAFAHPLSAEEIGQIAQTTEPWNASVVRPLRELRTHLKPRAQHDMAVSQLRQQVKDSELFAEKLQCAHLFALHAKFHVTRTNGDRLTAVEKNLTSVVTRFCQNAHSLHAPMQALLNAIR